MLINIFGSKFLWQDILKKILLIFFVPITSFTLYHTKKINIFVWLCEITSCIQPIDGKKTVMLYNFLLIQKKKIPKIQKKKISRYMYKICWLNVNYKG